MKNKKNIFTNKIVKFISSIILTTLFLTGAVYAWSTISQVSDGEPLLASSWNEIVSGVNENGNKLVLFSKETIGNRINTGGDYSYIALGQNTNDKLYADNKTGSYYGGGLWFRIDDGAGGYNDSLRLSEDGNVGIGITPTTKLDVNGDVKVNGKIIQDAWVAPVFESGWVNYVGYAPAGYYKDKESRVYLRGLIKNGATGNNCFFTLPAGYRPQYRKIVLSQTAGGSVRIDIQTNGCIRAEYANSGRTSLEGISFRAY